MGAVDSRILIFKYFSMFLYLVSLYFNNYEDVSSYMLIGLIIITLDDYDELQIL